MAYHWRVNMKNKCRTDIGPILGKHRSTILNIYVKIILGQYWLHMPNILVRNWAGKILDHYCPNMLCYTGLVVESPFSSDVIELPSVQWRDQNLQHGFSKNFIFQRIANNDIIELLYHFTYEN